MIKKLSLISILGVACSAMGVQELSEFQKKSFESLKTEYEQKRKNFSYSSEDLEKYEKKLFVLTNNKAPQGDLNNFYKDLLRSKKIDLVRQKFQALEEKIMNNPLMGSENNTKASRNLYEKNIREKTNEFYEGYNKFINNFKKLNKEISTDLKEGLEKQILASYGKRAETLKELLDNTSRFKKISDELFSKQGEALISALEVLKDSYNPYQLSDGKTLFYHLVENNCVDEVKDLVLGDSGSFCSENLEQAARRFVYSKNKEITPLELSKRLNNVFSFDLYNSELYNSESDDRSVFIDLKNDDGSIPLHAACISGSLEMVKLFVENGSDLNTFNKDGFLPFHYAIEKGHKEVINYFFDMNNFDVVQKVKNKDGDYAIHLAIKKSNFEVVKDLFNKKGSNIVNLLNNKKQLPIHLAVKGNKLDILKLLIEDTHSFNLVDSEGFSILDYAVKSRNKNIIEILLKNNENVLEKFKKNASTVTFLESINSQNSSFSENVKENLKNLINDNFVFKKPEEKPKPIIPKKKIQPKTVKKSKFDDLSEDNDKVWKDVVDSIYRDTPSKLDKLLKKNQKWAKQNIVTILKAINNNSGLLKHALKYIRSIQNLDWCDKERHFYYAIYKSDLDFFKDLLLKTSPDFYFKEYHLIHIVVKEKNFEFLKMLIESYGGKEFINSYDDFIRRPLDVASAENIINYLKQYNAQESKVIKQAELNGTDEDIKNLFKLIENNNEDGVLNYIKKNKDFVAWRDENNCTPLHVAAKEGFGELTKQLILYGADRDAVSNDNKRPFDIALDYFPKNCVDNDDEDDISPGGLWDYLRTLKILSCNSDDELKKTELEYKVQTFSAIEQGDCETIAKYLSNKLINFDWQTLSDRENVLESLLHIAVGYGHLDIVKLLISYGFNCKTLNEKGDTVLSQLGFQIDNEELFEYLVVEKKLNLNDKSYDGDPLFWSILYNSDGYEEDAIISFFKKAKKSGLNLNAINEDGDNVLHLMVYLSMDKYPNVFKFLVDSGVSLEAKNNEDESASDLLKSRDCKVYNIKKVFDLI